MSWYKTPTDLGEAQEVYLDMIESVFRVQHPDGSWHFIKLTPHQREFHKDDIAVTGHKAKSCVIEKSRNTSFTTSALIRMLTGNFLFRDEDVPFVRINEQKVKELVKECKKIIKHMRPIKLENGDLWPFDPTKTKVDNTMLISFPDRGVDFIAYPASASAAENIRGLRITRGLLDECNFVKTFNDIHIAMRDAARGATPEGLSYFQTVYGSTLKGETPFKKWLDKVKKLKLRKLKIFSWPLFNPDKLDIQKAREGVTFIEQGLIPIVTWHDMEDVWDKFREDEKSFLEEFMTVCVADESKYYNSVKVLSCVDELLRHTEVPSEPGEFYMGVDPAGEGGDYFSINIVEKTGNKYAQRYQYYLKKDVFLPDMNDHISKLIDIWLPVKCRIDSNGLGYELGQSLERKYTTNVVERIRGAVRVKSKSGGIPMKQFMHLNLRKIIEYKLIKILNDDVTLYQFTQFDYTYDCPRDNEYGHGDNIISLGLACLPANWKFGIDDVDLMYQRKEEHVKLNSEVKKELEEFNKPSNLKARLDFYKKRHKSRR